MALVLYTELKYKRLNFHGVSVLTYTGEINEENLPRSLPVETVIKDEKNPEFCTADENFGGEIKFELDVDYLKSLDPKSWKDQDHYAVLGLQNSR
jgi:hypothetical protein